MPWFKVDDTLHSHPKARRAGLSALGLWAVSGSYSMAYKEDGFVPLWFVKGFPKGESYARRLVDAKLWEPTEKAGEPGWQFKDWADYQPTSDEIEAEREKARERQRERRRRLREGKADSNKAAGVTPPVTGSVTPDVTRDVPRESRAPVPSRPVPSRPTSSEGGTPAPRRKPSTPLPEDWKPNAKHAEFAAANGIDLSSQAFRFRNWAMAKDQRYADWDAAFRNWLGKALDFAKDDQKAGDRPEPPSKALMPKCKICNAPPEQVHYDECPEYGQVIVS